MKNCIFSGFEGPPEAKAWILPNGRLKPTQGPFHATAPGIPRAGLPSLERDKQRSQEERVVRGGPLIQRSQKSNAYSREMKRRAFMVRGRA
jgi:hypothetical protein